MAENLITYNFYLSEKNEIYYGPRLNFDGAIEEVKKKFNISEKDKIYFIFQGKKIVDDKSFNEVTKDKNEIDLNINLISIINYNFIEKTIKKIKDDLEKYLNNNKISSEEDKKFLALVRWNFYQDSDAIKCVKCKEAIMNKSVILACPCGQNPEQFYCQKCNEKIKEENPERSFMNLKELIENSKGIQSKEKQEQKKREKSAKEREKLEMQKKKEEEKKNKELRILRIREELDTDFQISQKYYDSEVRNTIEEGNLNKTDIMNLLLKKDYCSL